MLSLVGWIFGAKPVLGRLKGFIRSKWGDENTVSVSELKPGIFIFKFAREEDCNRILALGPWSFDNRPLVIKPWSPDENYELESVTALPVWVRFSGWNLHMRNEEILSMLASTIGKPIRMDGFTAGSDKLSYARVLIEVYAEHEMKREVCIKGPRGTNFYQRVQYDWLPPRCEHCHRFGHEKNLCPLPRLRMDEDDEDDPRVLLDPENNEFAEVRDCEVMGIKANQSFKGAVVEKSDSQIGSSGGLESVVPEIAVKDDWEKVAEDKDPADSVEVMSSNREEGIESFEDSRDTIESEEPFTEVKRKLKKKVKKRRSKGKGGLSEVPVGLSKWNNHSGGNWSTSLSLLMSSLASWNV
ncbi:hypothetical protein QQ045_009838 [Rhodiola kirilowii]